MEKGSTTFAKEIAMDQIKICSKCNQAKEPFHDFYFCKGKMRSECKACTVKRNVRYQRKVQSWRFRFVDNDSQRSYMVEYYRKNKEKFAEYRRKFKEKYPEYYKMYARERKNKT